MSLVVIDASVMVTFYATNDPRRQAVIARLTVGDALFAPAHFDVEIVSALRGLSRSSAFGSQNVPAALDHLSRFPIRRMDLSPLMPRTWELRNNLTPYDAAYVALAEALGGPIVTCDEKLAAATGPTCDFELIR